MTIDINLKLFSLSMLICSEVNQEALIRKILDVIDPLPYSFITTEMKVSISVKASTLSDFGVKIISQ